MTILGNFFRPKYFSTSIFMKTFSGNKNEFKKLNKEQLECLLRQGFSEKNFPVEMFIDYLIKTKWDFNEKFKSGFLPLNSACSHGKLEVVKKMIEAGADVHAKDVYEVGTLDYACRSGNLNLVKFLLSLDVEINCRDSSGHGPIFSAVKFGHYNIFALLIDKGADIHTTNHYGTTLLHSAASKNSFEIVNKLIELGADINAEDNLGKTVLDYASLTDHHAMVKRLIELGAPVAKYCQNSEFACDMAMIFNDIDMLKLFLVNGAKSEQEGLNLFFCINGGAEFDYRDDDSSYDKSDYQETSLDMIEYLVSLDMDINQQCPRTGKTPLMQICLKGTLEQVKLLLNHKADCKLTDFEGRTSLHYAAHGSNNDIISHLIKTCKMDPNIRSSTGQTPLHVLREYDDSPGTIKTLIDLGADINAQDNQKQIPLHVFTQAGYADIVDLLLKYGARNDIFDINSKRPVDLCLQNTFIRKVYAKYSIYQFTVLESIFLCIS